MEERLYLKLSYTYFKVCDVLAIALAELPALLQPKVENIKKK